MPDVILMDPAPEDGGIPLWVQALGFGLFSAVSLPIGAILGILMAPVSDKVSARWMAFGSGALVFAVATQLYGAALFRLLYAAELDKEKGIDCGHVCQERFRNVNLQNCMGIVGALLYLLLNRWLERLARPKGLDDGFVSSEGMEASEEAPVASNPVGSRTLSVASNDVISGNSRNMLTGRRRTQSEVPVTQVMSSPIAALKAWRRANRTLSQSQGGPANGNNISCPDVGMADDYLSFDGRIVRRTRSISARELPDESTDLTPSPAASPQLSQGLRREARSAPSSPAIGRERRRLMSDRPTWQLQISPILSAHLGEDGNSSRSQSQHDEAQDCVDVEEEIMITGNVALSMWLGLLLDGIPEALMLGFMTNEHTISFEFLIAIFIANFPEAFSGASLLRSQGMSVSRIFAMWFLVFVVTGVLAMVGSLVMPDTVSKGSTLEEVRDSSTAAFEGLTGGAMLAMISTAMLPEAFKGAGSIAGVLFVFGFVVSVFINGLGARYGGPQEKLDSDGLQMLFSRVTP